MKLVFRSRIDSWLLVVLVTAAAMSLFASTMAVLSGVPARWLLAIVLLALGAGLPLWVLRSTCYTLTDSELQVRSGPFRWTVPLRDIRTVTPTRNPLSSPALSRDRLRIDYGAASWLMISPLDKQRFLLELEARRQGSGGSLTPAAR